RLDPVHLLARRRRGALPHGRERAERTAHHQRPGLRRSSLLQPRLRTDRLAGFAPHRPALKDYQQLLGTGLVRPTNLEIFVAKADGTEARQLTYFAAQSFTPYFTPAGDRVLFSSNAG